MSKTVDGVSAPLRNGLVSPCQTRADPETYGTTAPSTFHLVAYRHVHGSSWFAGFVQHPTLLPGTTPRWDSTRREWIHTVWAFVAPDGAPFRTSLEALERADGDVVAVSEGEWTRLSKREEYVFWPAYRLKLMRSDVPAALAYAHRVVRGTSDEAVWRAVSCGRQLAADGWEGEHDPGPPVLVVQAATPTRDAPRRPGWRMVT
ncbi:hypothetical protein Q8F55_005979 [Vanrija albida]|uniref:Uncharacterized protein n=1 Tax=Vanrija albida TaxID=181172 RepID=A0ABR3Q335_9TREE